MHFNNLIFQRIFLADDCQEESVIVMKYLLLQAQFERLNPYDVKR